MALDPRVFLSYDVEHDEYSRRLFAEQASDSPTPFVVQDWSCKEEQDEDEWRAVLTFRVSLCHLMIVLVGRHTAVAGGVAKEIRAAVDRGVPYFGVYVDGADASLKLPTGLARNRTIWWNWNAIGTAVDRMMTEGKNAG